VLDVGFWELALLAVIGLIVLGPERLPRVARTLGLWAGRARGYVRSFTTELERETRVGEMRAQFEEARRDVERLGDDAARGRRALEADVRGDGDAPAQKAESPDTAAAEEPSGTPTRADDDRGERR